MRRPRHLSPEERALWDRVADRTVPMDPKRKQPDAPAPSDATKRKTPELHARNPLPDFRIAEKASAARPHDLLSDIPDRLSRAPVRMDPKNFGKMKRGKLKPEARIDLHGMTVDQAHPALLGFILKAQASGLRLVLVITGKGKDRDDGGPIPVRHGVLRHQVPQWLGLPPLSQAVLQITPAHLRHGGLGAYYVYLRRNR